MWAVLPIKSLQGGKGRLSSVLSEEERGGLVRAMVRDVLDALGAAKGLAGTLVISSDPQAQTLAEETGARFLREKDAHGLNEAIAQAAEQLAGEGVQDILIIHGDVPLATAEEVDQIIDAHGAAPAVTFAPASEDGGTNAMAVSPPNLLKFQYGTDSFDKHRAGAEEVGITPKVLDLQGIGLDIDRPEDLEKLLLSARPGRTSDYVLESGIAEKLKQAKESGAL